MAKKVLVTGGNGFIGSHIVDLLLKKKYSIVVISRVTPNRFVGSRSNTTHYRINLKNYEEIERCLNIEQPDVICHHAASTPYPRESLLNPEKTFEDVLCTTNLLEAAKKTGVKHFIFPSSSNIYHSYKNKSYKENSKKNPLSPIGISKMMIEDYMLYLQHTTDIVCTIFRYFNVYGPRQRFGEFTGIIANLINKALKNEKVTIFGDGNQTRDFIYVSDIASANLAAIESPVSGIFNVGVGKGTSIRKLIATIEKLMRKKIPQTYTKGRREITNSIADISKIKKVLNWKSKVTLEQGLKNTINYYKKSSQWKNS